MSNSSNRSRDEDNKLLAFENFNTYFDRCIFAHPRCPEERAMYIEHFWTWLNLSGLWSHWIDDEYLESWSCGYIIHYIQANRLLARVNDLETHYQTIYSRLYMIDRLEISYLYEPNPYQVK